MPSGAWLIPSPGSGPPGARPGGGKGGGGGGEGGRRGTGGEGRSVSRRVRAGAVFPGKHDARRRCHPRRPFPGGTDRSREDGARGAVSVHPSRSHPHGRRYRGGAVHGGRGAKGEPDADRGPRGAGTREGHRRPREVPPAGPRPARCPGYAQEGKPVIDRIEEALRGMLSDPSVAVRLAASAALDRLRAKKSLSTYHQMLTNGPREEKVRVVFAAEEITTRTYSSRVP